MEKILFISYVFDKNTPVGAGAKRVVSELANLGMHVMVVTAQHCSEKIPNVEIIVKKNFPRLPVKLSNRLSNLFGKELLYFMWEIRAYFAGKRILDNNRDAIAIYTRANPIAVCPVGIRLRKKFNIPLLMHFTDPIPAPVEWCPDEHIRKRQIKQMLSFLPHVDLLSFGNKHMLLYQERVLGRSLDGISFISPDPSFREMVFLPLREDSDNTVKLLFLGNIYGNRNPMPLFEAIQTISDIPVKLYVYGNNSADFPSFVIKKSRTDDVRSVMQNMDILIDIDGDDETPVFISSKLKDYLSINRPILSISPLNSPSRDLLNGLKTAVTVKNTKKEISSALLKIIETNYSDEDYDERIEILKQFSAQTIAKEIATKIDILYKKSISNQY